MGYVKFDLSKETGLEKLDGLLVWNYKREGIFVEYGSGGMPCHFRTYKNGELSGYEKIYFASGKLFKIILHEGSEYEPGGRIEKVITVYNGDGEKIVQNGEGESEEWTAKNYKEKGEYRKGLRYGVWEGFYDNGEPWYTEEYGEEGLIEGKSYDKEGKGYTYESITQSPVFKGGKKEMYRIIGDNLHYPQDAVNKGIEGRVLIKFFVDKRGHIFKKELLESLHPHLDQLAMEAVQSLDGKWKPGLYRGQAWATYFTLPIFFSLN
ncbi:energy transducer TonB [Marinilongibacter aquaticus]|uniref:energy transducer TonB n=1 Tax=Marinilongibacter aquaticus TaxID=2975157 RepID=UPI0021BD6D27|nr:energy transducer TonB [Marinilongibacter aquaticus]UBM57223.1 energy transducer TonB [Marinilongibacter aquaticus]